MGSRGGKANSVSTWLESDYLLRRLTGRIASEGGGRMNLPPTGFGGGVSGLKMPEGQSNVGNCASK